MNSRTITFRKWMSRIVLTLFAAAVFLGGDRMGTRDEANQDFVYSLKEGNIKGVDYYFVKIPKFNGGRLIRFKVGFADNTPGSVKTVGEFAAEKEALVTINGGFFRRKDGTNLPYGAVIIDGEPVYAGSPYKNVRNAQTLAIMEDGTFRYYKSGALDIDKMIGDGVRHAITGRLPVITEGKETDYDDSEGRFQIIGYDDRNYYIFTSEDGLRISDAAAFLLTEGLKEAYVMDGGGSVSTNICNERINPGRDKESREERKVATFIYAAR